MQHVVAIIQARLSSSRLPRKVLLPLPTGRLVIEEVVFRARQIKGVDAVVVATPDDEGDKIQEAIFRSKMLGEFEEPKVFVFQGPHHDVLRRYVLAAEAFDATHVIRITADCPLLDPRECEKIMNPVLSSISAYASNVMPRTLPQGLDCELFTREILAAADGEATESYDREHVTPWMQRQKGGGRFIVGSWQQGNDESHIRWTLDTLEDYVTICQEFQRRMKVEREIHERVPQDPERI